MKRRVSNRLRWAERALWILGVVLLGGTLAATSLRWSYQARQESALFSESVSPPQQFVRAAEVDPPRRLVVSTETMGPAQPVSLIKKQEAKPVVVVEKKRPPKTIDPFAVGRIEIPRLGVRAIIRKGADEKTLARAVGLVPGAAFPGEMGNVVLAAHRDTFFRPLRKIKVDDRIRVHVPPENYEYRVESVRIVTPEETSVLQSRGVEELTLVTCYPFNVLGPAPDRFIVSAKRVMQ
jgi:sortase A